MFVMPNKFIIHNGEIYSLQTKSTYNMGAREFWKLISFLVTP